MSAMEFEEALICWDKALEIDGENIEVWHSRGLTFYYMEDYEEAVKCYNRSYRTSVLTILMPGVIKEELFIIWEDMKKQ